MRNASTNLDFKVSWPLGALSPVAGAAGGGLPDSGRGAPPAGRSWPLAHSCCCAMSQHQHPRHRQETTLFTSPNRQEHMQENISTTGRATRREKPSRWIRCLSECICCRVDLHTGGTSVKIFPVVDRLHPQPAPFTISTFNLCSLRLCTSAFMFLITTGA